MVAKGQIGGKIRKCQNTWTHSIPFFYSLPRDQPAWTGGEIHDGEPRPGRRARESPEVVPRVSGRVAGPVGGLARGEEHRSGHAHLAAPSWWSACARPGPGRAGRGVHRRAVLLGASDGAHPVGVGARAAGDPRLRSV